MYTHIDLARANNDIRWYFDIRAVDIRRKVLVIRCFVCRTCTHIDLRGLVVRASIDLLARVNNDIRWYGELGRVDLHEVIGLR